MKDLGNIDTIKKLRKKVKKNDLEVKRKIKFYAKNYRYN